MRDAGIIELAAGEASQEIRALFPRKGHVWRRSFAVLDGTAGGRIFTDDLTSPTWAAAQEFSDDNVLIPAGALNRELIQTLLDRLRADRSVTIGAAASDPLLKLLPNDADAHGTHIDFEDREASVDLNALVVVPDGLRLARIDRDLVTRCAWNPWLFESDDMAVAHGIGFCLLAQGQVVSEAYAGPVVAGELEMATITAPGWQRRGLARIVCAQTILECERQGYRTWWNTSLRNVASATLARSLGYTTERLYPFFRWESTAPVA